MTACCSWSPDAAPLVWHSASSVFALRPSRAWALGRRYDLHNLGERLACRGWRDQVEQRDLGVHEHAGEDLTVVLHGAVLEGAALGDAHDALILRRLLATQARSIEAHGNARPAHRQDGVMHLMASQREDARAK